MTGRPCEEDRKIKLVSIFHTLDGECTLDGPGQWSTFVRTAGCNERCWKSTGYCDAPHSLEINRDWWSPDIGFVVGAVMQYAPCKRVTISGGEPMIQREEVAILSQRLRSLEYKTNLETNGSIIFEPKEVGSFDCIIMDVKPPSTEMAKLNKTENMALLRPSDYVKFVIENEQDYRWSLHYIQDHPTDAKIAFGCRYGYLEPLQLIEWIRRDRRFDIRLNLQTHKYIWPNAHPAPVQDLSLVDIEAMSKREV